MWLIILWETRYIDEYTIPIDPSWVLNGSHFEYIFEYEAVHPTWTAWFFKNKFLPLQQPDPENHETIGCQVSWSIYQAMWLLGSWDSSAPWMISWAAGHPSATNTTRSVKIGEIASRNKQRYLGRMVGETPGRGPRNSCKISTLRELFNEAQKKTKEIVRYWLVIFLWMLSVNWISTRTLVVFSS